MQRAASLVAAALCGALLFHITAAVAQNRDTSRAVRLFEGVSARGDLQDALDDASSRALRALPGADRLVQYRVREITGEAGGIRGGGAVKVVIEVASDEVGRRPNRPNDPNDEDREQDVLTRAVQAEVRVARETERGEPVALELTLVNTSDDTVRIPLNTGQKFDFEVWRDNRMVWKWSAGRFFTQALGVITLMPKEEVTYKTTWDQRNADGVRVPAGTYQLRGYVPTKWAEFRIGSTSNFAITGR